MTHSRLSKKDKTRVKPIITDVEKYLIKSKGIKVVPLNKNSRKTINDAIAIYRKLWNCCVNELNSSKTPNTTLTYLRDKFITKKNMSVEQIKTMEWTFRISKRTREIAITQFISNYNTATDNLKKYTYKYIRRKSKNGKIRKIKKVVRMRYKNISDEKQTIYLNKEECMIENNILTTFNGVKLKLSEQVKDGRPECNLVLSRINFDYYIYIPEYAKPAQELKQTSNRIIAVDPGVNIFATYYCPDGEWGEIGIGLAKKLDYVYKKIGKIGSSDLSKASKFKAIGKLNRRKNQMIDDFHWKLTHWFLSNFDKIIIPRLYVARCNPVTKKHQADLRHCSFVDRLIHKSLEYTNSIIYVGKEHNTTKACTKCLSLNTTRDKVVKCNDCGHITHRDLNGSRNMILKHCY